VATSGKKTCFDAGKIRCCHCAAVLQTQVPKLCTDLDLGLLYILISGMKIAFIITRKRNNVVVSFGTLKVQSLSQGFKASLELSTNRPTQLIIYVPLLVCVFHKSILLIVQYKYLKSCCKDFKLQNLILRTRVCGTGFIPQHCCVVDFQLTKMVRWKCFVPGLYQPRKGKSTGLSIFNILT